MAYSNRRAVPKIAGGRRFAAATIVSPMSGGAKLRGRDAVERTIGKEHDAVFAECDVAADQPVGDIGGDLFGVALGWVAKAAAARQFEPGIIAAGNRLPTLRA